MKTIKTVGLAAKPTSAQALELTKELSQWLHEKGLTVLIDIQVADLLNGANRDRYEVVDRSELPRRAELIIVLGGDGTLLSVCRHVNENSPILIGVNLGTLGFLTDISPNDLISIIEKTLNNEALLEKRLLLQATVCRGDNKILEGFAFNDVVITKDFLARLTSIKFFVNDQFAAIVRGDGVIISSPSGSTGYSLSAGGSIVHPQVEALIVTPICPHSLTNRPLVLPADSSLKLEIASPQENEVFLTLDGQAGMPLEHGDTVKVTTSTRSVFFVRSKESSYFDALTEKLKWGQQF